MNEEKKEKTLLNIEQTGDYQKGSDGRMGEIGEGVRHTFIVRSAE